jgi:hypothetical protein
LIAPGPPSLGTLATIHSVEKEQPMVKFIVRHAKSISLIAGFLFGILGSGWSFVFDDGLNEDKSSSLLSANLVAESGLGKNR